jgi:hypothetical protein
MSAFPRILLTAFGGEIVSEFAHETLERPEVISVGGRIFLWRGDDQREGRWFRVYREVHVHGIGQDSSISAINPEDIRRYIDLTNTISEELAKSVKPISTVYIDSMKERLVICMRIMEDIVKIYQRRKP